VTEPTISLTWRPVAPHTGGPAISTSLTAAEAARLGELAKGRKVLEVGAAYGYSTVVLASSAASLVSVDPHVWLQSEPALRANLDAYGVTAKVDVRVGASEDVLPALAAQGRRFGLIWVDGDHRRPAIERDVALSVPLLTKTGVLACHDFGEATCPDVREVLRERFGEPHELVDTLAIYRGLGS